MQNIFLREQAKKLFAQRMVLLIVCGVVRCVNLQLTQRSVHDIFGCVRCELRFLDAKNTFVYPSSSAQVFDRFVGRQTK